MTQRKTILVIACCMAACTLVSFGTLANVAFAQQQHKGAPTALSMDVLFMNDNTTLYGVLYDVVGDELTMVVQRDWLKKNYRSFYDGIAETEAKAAVAAESRLVERINTWIEERKDDVNLTIFLEDQRAAADKRRQEIDLESKRFAFVIVDRSDVRKVTLQTAERRLIGLLAWKHQLADVEVTPAADLKKELQKQKIEPGNSVVDFSDDVPSAQQTDREWAMRQAIVEHVFREPLEFQGTGDTFFRRGDTPGLGALISQMMGAGGLGGLGGGLQELGEELGIPEFTRSRRVKKKHENRAGWWKKQAEIAEKEGFRSFSITRLNQDLATSKVTVDVVFVGKNEVGQWQLMAQFEGVADADQQSDQDVEALMDDPQVKQIIAVAEGLGVGAGDQIKKALRHGVATQAAMQDGLSRLFDYTDGFSQQLNAPKIPSSQKRR